MKRSRVLLQVKQPDACCRQAGHSKSACAASACTNPHLGLALLVWGLGEAASSDSSCRACWMVSVSCCTSLAMALRTCTAARVTALQLHVGEHVLPVMESMLSGA